LKEGGVAVVAEVLERADRHDSVEGLVELLPALQQNPLGPWTVHLIERLLDVGGLILQQRQTDDVDVVALNRASHGGTPAAPDVKQRHSGLQSQLSQRQVDLGDLRLLERHVVVLEERATVGLGRVEEQAEEVVRQVIVRLHVFKMRPELLRHVDARLSGAVGAGDND
jgi:hypothetical protein